MVRRLLFVAVALLATLALVAEATPASAAPDPVSAENEFVARINDLRASVGVAPLTVDPGLTALARDWAATMAAAGQIFHRPSLAAVAPDPTWIKLGENVGVGPSVPVLHDAFVASPLHYRNLVDPDFREVGIGVVTVGETIYVAENFMRTERDAATVAASATAAPAAAPVAAARSTCTTKKCRASRSRRPVRKPARRTGRTARR